MDIDKIANIAKRVATAYVGAAGGGVSEAYAHPTVDLDGREALRIVIILPSSAVARIEEGDAAINTLFEIKELLQREGEDRFPYIEYATKEEAEGAAT